MIIITTIGNGTCSWLLFLMDSNMYWYLYNFTYLNRSTYIIQFMKFKVHQMRSTAQLKIPMKYLKKRAAHKFYLLSTSWICLKRICELLIRGQSGGRRWLWNNLVTFHDGFRFFFVVVFFFHARFYCALRCTKQEHLEQKGKKNKNV